jgi:hypothetical protein
MKLHKILIVCLMFFAGSVFTNDIVKIKPYDDIVNKIEFAKYNAFLDANYVFENPGLLAVNWTEFDFGAGDTTVTYDVAHAEIIYFVYRDSSLTGTDTLWIGVTNTLSNGLVLDAPVKVQNMNQTTSTTFLSGSALIPGNNTTTIYAITPVAYSQSKFTGTIKVARLNVNDNITPYVPKGRGIFAAE